MKLKNCKTIEASFIPVHINGRSVPSEFEGLVKCVQILLPNGDKQPLYNTLRYVDQPYNSDIWEPQDCYIFDREAIIHAGDYVIYPGKHIYLVDSVNQSEFSFRIKNDDTAYNLRAFHKVIATTNATLNVLGLPSVSTEFLKNYCENMRYKHIEMEMVDNRVGRDSVPDWHNENCLIPKLDVHSNVILRINQPPPIMPDENITYSRGDMINAMNAARIHNLTESNGSLTTWLDNYSKKK